MAIEIADITNFLGVKIGEDATLEDFKKAFGGEFVRRSAVKNDDKLVNEIVGARMGSLDVLIRREAKQAGIEISDDMEGKKLEDLIPFAVKGVAEQSAAKIKDLETQLKSQDFASEREQILAEKQKLEDKMESLQKTNKKVKEEFDNYKQEVVNTENRRVLDGAYEEAFANQQLKPGITPIEQKGFNSVFKTKYKIDFDENKQPAIYDLEGKPIANPDQADSFLSIEDVIKKELIENQLHQKNPHQPQPAQPVPPAAQVAQGGGNGTGNQDQPKVHPAAAAHAEAVKGGE